MARVNKAIVLKSYPDGEPIPDNFKLVELPLRELNEGEVLLKTLFFSLDPYMRPRMTPGLQSYIKSYELNQPLSGGSICRVEESNNAHFEKGDIVQAGGGWQTRFISKGNVLNYGTMSWSPDDLQKIPSDIKSTLFLGSLGMPGLTAQYGLMGIGEPKAGETVVVSAATGAVGSIVGQLAKLEGCRVVGVASGSEKCSYAKKELGYDDCIDRKEPNMAENLKAACPNGVDVYFDNVGGEVFWAVFPLMNIHGRIPVCGAISGYSKKSLDSGPDRSYTILRTATVKRLKIQGLLAFDAMPLYADFLKYMKPFIKEGKIKFREDIVKGIENAPEAFIDLLKGKNFGKLIIEI